MTDTPAAAKKTVVHLVRHGEVENPHRVLYGRLPGYHLSSAGQQMAKAAADWLAGRDVRLLMTSPMERAQETAVPIAAEFGLTPETGRCPSPGTGRPWSPRCARPGASRTGRSRTGCWPPPRTRPGPPPGT